MDYFFVSDDSYFLRGVSELCFSPRSTVEFIRHGHPLHEFRPEAGDVVVVKITDAVFRNRILRHPGLTACRLMILLSAPLVPAHYSRDNFPWLIADNIGTESLLFILSRAERTEIKYISMPESERRMFWYLGSGYSLSVMAKNTGLSAKYLHGLKIRAMRRYGLAGGHASGILLCRDLADMTSPHSREPRTPTGRGIKKRKLPDISDGRESSARFPVIQTGNTESERHK